MIVFLSIDFSSLPRVLLDVDFYLQDVTVGTQKMATEEDGELFGAGDAVFLSQNIDGILLRIGRYNVGVVAIQVVFVSRQSQVGIDLQFLDRMDWTISLDVQQLDASFAFNQDRVKTDSLELDA